MYDNMYDQEKNQNRQIGALMNSFVEQAVKLYSDMNTLPVCPAVKKDSLESLRNQSIPVDGRLIQEVYAEMLNNIYTNAPLPQHPRSFACVPSTTSLLSWMGDVMTSAYNPHASCKFNAPAADVIERKLIRWLCDLAGYPKESGGLFVSGGSMANLTALTAARDAKLSFDERPSATVYLSDQTHSSVSKGLHIIGFGKEQLRIIPSDKVFRMDMSALRKAISTDIADGRKPFAVVASAGTTNTGSVDPLKEISALCRQYGMWMHVDGAYGASALLSEEHRESLSGIELSDSLSWDAHKWMMQTYGCSMVLVRNQSTLSNSFSSHPEYLKDAAASPDSIELWDLGPELTRPARSLKLWLTLQVLGTRQMADVIDHGCDMARLVERLLIKNPNWEIISHAQLGIVNFRYKGDGALNESQLDKINQNIAKEITESGFAQIFTTELCGKKVLRMCTINPKTTEKDIFDTIQQLDNSISVAKSHQAIA